MGRGVKIAGIAGLVALLFVFTALRLDLRPRAVNYDEEIPAKVSQAMSSMGRLDPNWALADVPASLKYPQYNFYSYNIASHAVVGVARVFSVRPLVALRFANLLYQAVAIAAVVAMLWNLGAAIAVWWLAAGLLAVAPAMVHDAHMARPESFLYMLFALAALAATLRTGLLARAVMVGAIVGVGTACKVTFIATGLVLVPLLWPVSRHTLAAAAAGAVVAIVAFAASAPYALINFDVFLNGLSYLVDQYSGSHPPHSLIDRSALGSLAWTAEFLLKLYGPLIPAALILPLILGRSALLIGLWLAAIAVLGYFAPKPVLFERNLSLGIFAAAVLLAAMAERSRLAWACAIIAALPMAYWSAQIAFASAGVGADRFKAWSATYFVSPVTAYWSGARDPELPKCRGQLLITNFNDELSRRAIEKAAREGYEFVSRYRSRFDALPVSTLHTYVEPGAVLFRCKP